MRSRVIAAALLLAALPCFAGIRFTAETRGDQGLEVRVNAEVSGARAKVLFVQVNNDSVAEGDYMLSPDAGRTLYMVSPRTRTYIRYDAQTMLAGMADLVRGMRGQMQFTFESPKIEKLADEDGGLIAGIRTRHYKYRTSYTVLMPAPSTDKVMTTIVEDIWTSEALDDPALGIWLKKDQASTGDEQLDSLIRAEMSKVEGFPLKRVTVTNTVDTKGVAHQTRAEMLVTALKQAQIPAAEFVLPRTYREVKPVRPDEED
jgi:hypothetical protein